MAQIHRERCFDIVKVALFAKKKTFSMLILFEIQFFKIRPTSNIYFYKVLSQGFVSHNVTSDKILDLAVILNI